MAFAKTNETQFSDLTEKAFQQAGLELKLHETLHQLAGLQAILPERDRQLAFAREALLGHARTIDRLELLRDKLQQALDAADTRINVQVEDLRQREDQNGRLAQELAGAREKITAMSDQIKTSVEVNSMLSAEIVSFKHALESSQQRETQSATTMAALAQNLAGCEANLAKAAEARHELETDLKLEKNRRREMETTRSWRWTSLLRKHSGNGQKSQK
jgi:chromosome segregation ATPase